MTRTFPRCVLRAPPFPKADAAVSSSGHNVADGSKASSPQDIAHLFELLREARVGGRYWADPVTTDRPPNMVIRPQREPELSDLLATLTANERNGTLWVAPDIRLEAPLRNLVNAEGGVSAGDVDPWSALATTQRLMAHGDDEWIVLARISGVPVTVLSPGHFGAPGDDAETLDNRAYRALMDVRYRNPFTNEPTTIEAVVQILGEWRTILTANRPIAAACGMAWWKRNEIRRFLWNPMRPLKLVRSSHRAVSIAAEAKGAVAIWPSRVSPALLDEARRSGVPLIRVEDGFVRSAGLGVELVPPSSVVVDAAGIHFDPSGPSDLENLLNDTHFSAPLLKRARELRETIVAAGISKYAAGLSTTVPARLPGRRLILVPGQVEDDMSVLAGGGGLTSNAELLRRVRAMEPEAEIWFRPHPDVDAGHRKGAVADAEVLTYADRIVRGGGMAPLLEAVDAVHVLTSLTGFEALLRGREVTCHGTPFYAGWGLTGDLGTMTERRRRTLSLDELVAGVLILYPRYLDPVTGLPCPPEILVHRMAMVSAANRMEWIGPLRRWQGRILAALR